jgi:hypothetical protein
MQPICSLSNKINATESTNPLMWTASAAKAVKRATVYGTAKAVPFVRQSLPQAVGSTKDSCAVQIDRLKNLIWTDLTDDPQEQ